MQKEIKRGYTHIKAVEQEVLEMLAREKHSEKYVLTLASKINM